MKLLKELNESVEYLVEEKDSGMKDYYIEGVFLQADIKNRNGRLYPARVLDKEVNRYIGEMVEKKRAFGELSHPDSPSVNLDRVSHVIKELRKEDSNWIGKAKIIDTPMGNIVKSFIDEGAVLGVSSRGVGSLKERNGANEVQEDFHLAVAADIVADPSAPDAFISGLMENFTLMGCGYKNQPWKLRKWLKDQHQKTLKK